MRKMIKTVVLGCVLGLVLNLNAKNIIKNGDLTEKSGWGLPVSGSWQVEGSNHFFRLEQKDPGKMVLVYRVFDIPEGTKALRLSVSARATDVVRGEKSWFDARVMTNFKGPEGKKGGPAIRFSNSDKWQTKSVEFLVPEGFTQFELMPALFQVKSGTIDYDDFILEPIDEQPILERQKQAAERKAKEIERRAAMVQPQVPTALPEQMPSPLNVESNYLQNAEGEKVWLQGVSIASMEWSASGEHILESINESITNWNVNCIRLPIRENFYFGKGKWQKDGGAGYRQLVDEDRKSVV